MRIHPLASAGIAAEPVFEGRERLLGEDADVE